MALSLRCSTNNGAATLASATTSSLNFGPVGHNNGVAASDTTNATFFGNANLPGTITYTLDTSTNWYGYDVTQIQTIAGWVSNSTTHANQDYDIEVSYVGSLAFVPLHTVTYLPFNGTPADANKSSMVTLTDDTGRIATNVDQLRFTFRQTGAWGNAAGFVLRELDVLGAATAVPEPSTALLLGVGLIGLTSRRRRGSAMPARLTRCAAVAIVSLLVAIPIAQANLINNPSFESPDIAGNQMYTTASQMDAVNWPISAGEITLVDGSFGTVAADGDQWLSLESNPGTIGVDGAISQTFNTVPGRLYDVSFAYSALSDGAITSWTLGYGVAGPTENVVINATGVPSLTLVSWATETYQFQAIGATTTLSFLGDQQRNGFFGSAIDNVSVTLVTPEPSTLTMMILFGVAATGRKFRQRVRPS